MLRKQYLVSRGKPSRGKKKKARGKENSGQQKQRETKDGPNERQKKSIGEVYANRGRESRMTVSFRAVYALHRYVDVRLAHKEKRKG